MVGALVDNGVLIALVETGSLTPTPGAVISKECAIVVMFVLNERITFAGYGGRGVGSRGRRFLTSNLVRTGGAAIGIAVLYVLYAWFGVWYVLANVVGIGVGFVANYVMESLATWRVHA